MQERQNYIFVGLDIHKETHTAVILNCWEEKLGSLTISNRPNGFLKLRNLVNKLKGNLGVVYGLEDVHHYGRELSIYLLDREEIVKEVNSALSYMERMSHPMTKKNDEWDSQCIASVLIRRYKELPAAEPDDLYWTLKMILKRRNSLVRSLSLLSNQLHNQLKDHYFSYKQFFSDVTCKTALAFYNAYPSPSHLDGVSIEELRTLLIRASHRTCSTNKALHILKFVHEDKDKVKDYQEARNFIVRSLIRDIEFKQAEVKEIEKQMEELRALFPCQLETIPGVQLVTSFSLIAYIGDISRFKSADKLARYSGVAPNHYGSAGKGSDKQSRQGNRRLYNILFFMAVGQIQVKGEHMRNPAFRAYFEKKTSEGKPKVQALICVMRKLVTIIYRMLKYNEPYKMPVVKVLPEPKKQVI